MCGQPPVSVFTNPDAVSLEAGQIQSHFERLLLTATIISTMGNTHILSGMVNHRARVGHQETTSFSPSSSNSRFSSNNETNRPSTNNQNVIRRLCSLSMAILGGPLPPSPGLVPMCWDELVDWTEEATLMTEMIQQRKRGDLNNLFSQPKKEADALSSQSLTSSSWHQVELKFIPFVSSCESEESLDRLSSLTYMEKVQFYQESAVVAVTDKTTSDILCLISVFQFCRYFSYIRRLADSLEHIPFNEGNNDAYVPSNANSKEDPLLPPAQRHAMNSRDDDGQEECVVCCDRKEYYVLMCCSHALCADCEKRWVRKRLHCPFCRQSFSSVREAAQTEWQLSVSAIPTEHILKDVKCLEQKIQEFWKTVIPPPPSTSETNKQSLDLESFLAQNYVRRRQRTIQTGDGEGGFVVVVV